MNEYEKKAVVHWYERYWQDVLMCRYIKDNFEFYTDEATTIAISKYYGFIKWLVENDKIDTTEIDKKIRIYDYVDKYEEYEYVFPDIYESLLMLLAISDTPIEDLILFLK